MTSSRYLLRTNCLRFTQRRHLVLYTQSCRPDNAPFFIQPGSDPRALNSSSWHTSCDEEDFVVLPNMVTRCGATCVGTRPDWPCPLALACPAGLSQWHDCHWSLPACLLISAPIVSSSLPAPPSGVRLATWNIRSPQGQIYFADAILSEDLDPLLVTES